MKKPEQPVLDKLAKELENTTQRELATRLGISGSFLNDIIKGKRGVDGIAEKLGFEKIVTYRKKR